MLNTSRAEFHSHAKFNIMQLVLLKLFNFLQFFPAGYPYLSTYCASKHALHVRIRLVTLFTFCIDMLAPKWT